MTDKTAPSFQKSISFRKFDFHKTNQIWWFFSAQKIGVPIFITLNFKGGIFLRMTGAEMVVKTLEKNGVKVVFGYPGAANCPIIDSCPFLP